MYYSPLENVKSLLDIDNIKYSDLEVLRNTAEGYCVEYKSQFGKTFYEEKLPKAVCAFSNRDGGWLFVGVKDNGEIEDVDLSSISIESFNSVISSRVKPLPYVLIKKIENPNKKGFGVVVFYTEKGKSAPFIANGTIYIRNGKTSEPADRSTLDLLIRFGYDYSDISLQCYGAKKNEFVFSPKKYKNIQMDDFLFYESLQAYERLGLYLQNDGKHFDENIELTLSIPRLFWLDAREVLNNNENARKEPLFDNFVNLPATKDIIEYKSQNQIDPVPFFSHYIQDYNSEEYLKYLYDKHYRHYQIIMDSQNVYYKIFFKEINPQQKIFLPAMLLCTCNLKDINYTITSKYSTSRICGLLKKHED